MCPGPYDYNYAYEFKCIYLTRLDNRKGAQWGNSAAGTEGSVKAVSLSFSQPPGGPPCWSSPLAFGLVGQRRTGAHRRRVCIIRGTYYPRKIRTGILHTGLLRRGILPTHIRYVHHRSLSLPSLCIACHAMQTDGRRVWNQIGRQ